MRRRVAILIGNQNYAEGSGFPLLRGPHNDVDAMAAVLQDPARGNFELAVPPLKDVTRGEMLRAIGRTLGAATADDTVLIHYSGHGKPDKQGRLYFAATDTDAEELRATGVRASEVHELASESPCRAIILLLDCCYSGAIGQAMNAGIRGDTADQLQQQLRRFAAEAKGLFILTSSTAWQTSAESEDEQGGRVMGRFTRAVVERLTAVAPEFRSEVRFSDLAQHVAASFAGQDAREFRADAQGDPLIARLAPLETPEQRREKILAGWVRDDTVPEAIYAPAFEAIYGNGSDALVNLVRRLLDARGMTPRAFASAVRSALPDEAVRATEEKAARREGPPKRRPKIRTIRDGPNCPELVVLPGGRFAMGSPPSETGRWDDESPVHEVTVPGFAIGRYPVTFEEWDACVAEGGCNGYRPEDQGWGRGRRPVINVSWHDAQAYVSWLSRKTGQQYRLPSEAEWEYAARGATTTTYPWGDAWDIGSANGDRSVDQTTEVGKYPANGFGLHDMIGNVWEWVADSWHSSYTGAPTDGAAWQDQKAERARVVRGGSWNREPRDLRAANRIRNGSGSRDDNLGFRVSRTLTQGEV